MKTIKILFINDAPLIKYGLAEGFKKNNCQTVILPLWRYEKRVQEKLFREKVSEFKPDIVFAEGHAGQNRKVFLKVIKELGLNLVYWAIEDPVHIHWISLPYAVHSKLVLTTAVEWVKKYQERGLNADTLIFGCNPDYHYHTEPVADYRYDLVFVGSNYDIRYDAARQIIMPLVEKDYNIKIWGLWWHDEKRDVHIPDKYYGGILPYEELSKVYSSAKIVLGVHCDNTSRTQTSMRTFEVLGCRAFYLTQYTRAHQHLFTEKKHLVWSHNIDETLKLADYYLNHEQERCQIAFNGQNEVYKKHTYHQRAAKVLTLLEKIL